MMFFDYLVSYVIKKWQYFKVVYFVTAYFLSEGELNGVFGMCARRCFLENVLKK